MLSLLCTEHNCNYIHGGCGGLFLSASGLGSASQTSRKISFPLPFSHSWVVVIFLEFRRSDQICKSAAMSFRMASSASSGMGVADDCKKAFLELKRKKVHRYLVFKIDEKTKQVVVEKTGGPAESYDDFTAALPDNDCRYAVYDFDYVTNENCQKSKIFFIAWSPELSRVRAKMIYATTKDRLRRELDGVHYELQATDATEMDIDVIKDRAN